MNLQTRVKDLVLSRPMPRPGDRLVVAVSGGPDSLCLLYALHALASDLDLRLEVAHLDHGLRPAAEAEAEFVKAQAEGLGLPFHLGRANTREHATAGRLSMEEAARLLRYRFLASVARTVGARAMAVAHTADDQAETVLMHFLRGAGLAGLKGMLPVAKLGSWMSDDEGWESEAESQKSAEQASDLRPPASDVDLLRPLLSTTRAEVEAYCQARGLEPRRDESNADTRFWRNRLRHELLPLLEQYNPRLRAVLARSATVLAGEHALVQAHIAALWDVVAPPHLQSEGQVLFDHARWLELTLPEQRALLREGVRRLRRHLRDVDFSPLEAAVRFSLDASTGRSCDVLAGLRLSITRGTVVLHPWGSEAMPARVPDGPWLEADGTLAAGWHFAVEPLEPEEWAPGQGAPMTAGRWTEFVDAGELHESLCLRARLPGDRFQPMGMGGHSTKLSDFMVNTKIGSALRARWPLVVCGSQVVWVAGLRLDERYKVRGDTQRVVRLRFYEA